MNRSVDSARVGGVLRMRPWHARPVRRPMGRVLLLGLLLLTGCGQSEQQRATAVRPLPSPATGRPDVILLSIDTLRADHLGCYRYGRPTSPFLDSMAEQGALFEEAWAPAPWTLPSHATMLSGRLSLEHGAIDQDYGIGSDVPMLAEAFEAAGYRTAAVVTSTFVSSRYGFARGFDDFHDFGMAEGSFDPKQAPDAREVFEQALQWTEQQPAAVPIFLFLHVYDVHYPYDAPAPFDERFNRSARPDELHYENYFHYLRHPLTDEQLEQQRGQYDEEIAFVDDALKSFHETWIASRPETLFLVSSDHGEEFGERGSWGHGHTLTPEQLHVPWIVWGPKIARQRIQWRVGLEDLAPTVADLVGIPFDAGDGHSRAGVLRGDGDFDPLAISARFASTSRRNSMKLRWHHDPYDLILDLRNGAAVLYDLSQDPAARSDLASLHPDELRTLYAELLEFIGRPWEARRAGTFESDGVFLREGRIDRGKIEVQAGERFALLPADASLSFSDGRGEQGGGPWQAVGGALPSGVDRTLLWHGEVRTNSPAALSEEQKERLRALGYMH